VKWGCDSDTAEPLCHISPCPFCNGLRDECVHCTGSNNVPIYRCPNKLVTQRHLDAISAANLVEHGILPDPGGWQDQANTFVRAFPLLCNEVNYWRRHAADMAAKRSK